MRTSNPALNENTFKSISVNGTGIMTIDGTVNKTGILLAFVALGAYFTWSKFNAGEVALAQTLGGIAALVGFIIAMITVFKKDLSPITAPLYACAEGVALGGVSAYFESIYPGIAFQAITATFGTLGALLLVYKSGVIKVTDNFRLGVLAATGGIALIYFIAFIMSFFGGAIPHIFGNGTIGIAFSVFVIAIAAMNLVLDFDFIENASQQALPKYMEWYGAFGLLVTLVWLYMEILRLLAKMRSR